METDKFVKILITEFGVKKNFIADVCGVHITSVTRKIKSGRWTKLESSAIFDKWGSLLKTRDGRI